MKYPHCEYINYDFWISKVKMEKPGTYVKLRLYGCPKCYKTFLEEDEVIN